MTFEDVVTPFQDPVWVDGVTPLNAVNMTKLQTRDEKGAPSGYVGLDASSAIHINGEIVSDKNVWVDFLNAGWKLYFGSAADTNLYRLTTAALATDGDMVFRNGAATRVGIGSIASNAGLNFGSAQDTNLYRSAANVLQTDDTFVVGGNTGFSASPQARNAQEVWVSSFASLITLGESVDGDANPAITMYRTAAGSAVGHGSRIWKASSVRGFVFQHANAAAAYGSEVYVSYLEIDLNGKFLFGPEGAQDTNLYRVAAGSLQTDTYFGAGRGILVGSNVLGTTPGDGIRFGSAADTNLYRTAAGQLKTDGHFFANGQLVVDYDNTGDKLWFSGAYDTSLYRSAAGALYTPGEMAFGGRVLVNMADATAAQVLVGQYGGSPHFAGITFGGDTYLYRSAAANLKTDGSFTAAVTVLAGGGGVPGNYAFYAIASGDSQPRWASYNDGTFHWGPGNAAVDTNLYRSAANTLKTDGALYVSGVLYLGTQNDIALYRSGASTVRTDAEFYAGGGLITLAQSGSTINDAFFANPQDGLIVVTLGNNKLWMRINGLWKGVVLT